MTTRQMHIRDAARWAARKDILVRTDRNGGPDWLCAAYSVRDNRVELIGYGDKCYDYAREQRAAGRDDVRVDSLDGIMQEMDEEAGEARCVPDAWDQREWA